MKSYLTFLMAFCLPLTVFAEERIYMPDFIEGKDTGAYYKKLIANKGLPEWVKGAEQVLLLILLI